MITGFEQATQAYPKFEKFRDACELAQEIDPTRSGWLDQYRTFIAYSKQHEVTMGFLLELKLRSRNSPIYGGGYDFAMSHLQKFHDDVMSMMPDVDGLEFILRPYQVGNRRVTGFAIQVSAMDKVSVRDVSSALVTVSLHLPAYNLDDKTSERNSVVLTDEGMET